MTRVPLEFRINAATMEQNFRLSTAKMTVYNHAGRTCRVCHRNRSVGQFKEGGTICLSCRKDRALKRRGW